MEKKHKIGSPHENTKPRAKGHLARIIKKYYHTARSLFITAALLLFLAIVPPFIRTALLRGLRAHPYLSGMLFFFSLLSLSLLWSTGQRIDALIFLYFNLRGKRPLLLDKIMLGFTQLGNGLFGIIVALVLFIIDDHYLSYEIILGTLTLWILVEMVKAIIHRSRPFIKLTQTRIVGPPPKGRSFPSGHTSQIFFMITLLIQHFHIEIWVEIVFLYILAILVAITRMYVGAHYPRDVLAGAMLGSFWGLLGVIIDAHFLVGK